MLACALLAAGLVVVIVGRSADSTPMMGAGLALLLLAVVAIQLVVRRRNRQFEAEMSSIHHVVDQARSRRGELLEDAHEDET